MNWKVRLRELTSWRTKNDKERWRTVEKLHEIAHVNVSEALGCRLARPGELGCFHQKAPPSVGTPWKAQVGLVAICNPLFTKHTPLCPFFCWFLFRNVTELYGLCNDTYFLSGMSRNFTDYATMPFLTSGMLWNFTDYATMLPFDFRHVAKLHELPNDGC